jgi:hypothetical protein
VCVLLFVAHASIQRARVARFALPRVTSFSGAIRIRHRGSEESSVDAVRRQFSKGVANSFTGSPDILRSQHSVERLNAHWRDSASSQRGSARKNGG